MPTSPSNWEIARQWGVFVAAAFSALFAGLIWVMARKRLRTRYTASADGFSQGALTFNISILNRSDTDVVIDAISARPPISIVVVDDGPIAATYSKPTHKSVQHVPRYMRIKPDQPGTLSLALRREGGFDDCRRVSIRLHIVSSFLTIRHKTKVVTAILPASPKRATP